MEASFLAQNFVPLMFVGLFVVLLTGYPVAFGLAIVGLGLILSLFCISLVS